ncbi:hypothetical protein BDZ89DRAFT_1036139 [Hymenopellis radicata]|nr:hypothetical protein BDZ89DRAFT_1036139 [Hymenopellis radicata]
MVHSSSPDKSLGTPNFVDTAEVLHLAQRLLDMTLQPHQAAMLYDTIAAATFVPDVAAEATASATGSSSSGGATSAVSVPPAYATQPPVSTAPVTSSTNVSSSGGPVASAATTVTVQPAPVLPALAASMSPPTTSNPPVAAGTQVTVTLPVTNNGIPPFQVLPANFQYVRPADGTPGPYYAITRGRVVGVVAGWDRASPSCIGVGGAVFRSVPSLNIGKQVVQTALAAGSCMILP